MDKKDYFKLQAKNLLRDCKTGVKDADGIYRYDPRFFEDLDAIISSFNISVEDLTLMQAQHIVARLAGFKSWSDLIHADNETLEQGEVRFKNRQDHLGQSEPFAVDRITFFKQQAENFFSDYKTGYLVGDETEDDPIYIYEYEPRYFEDIGDVIVSFDIDEDHFTLADAQDTIAYLSGFQDWAELLQASDAALELGELLLNNRHDCVLDEWQFSEWRDYLISNGLWMDSDELKLATYKGVFLNREDFEEIPDSELSEEARALIQWGSEQIEAKEDAIARMIFGDEMYERVSAHIADPEIYAKAEELDAFIDECIEEMYKTKED